MFIKRLVPRRIARAIRPYNSTPANDRMAVEQGQEMVDTLQEAGVSVDGRDVLEIGSGWLPTVPIVFAANGARRVVLTDVVRLADPQTWDLARRNVAANAPDLDIPTPLPFDYRAPTDLSDIESASVDLIISRTVLEHIPVEVLPNVLEQCRRVLRDDGAMCHIIDHTDHRAHVDEKLSFLDFLRYSPGQWAFVGRLWDSHQNRLRSPDYIEYFENAGFDIIKMDVFTHPERAFDVPYAKEFTKYSREDLRTCITKLILKKK